MNLQLPKGTRDFSPQEKIKRERITFALKEVFELFGYSPLETPILERFDVLSSKYAGGSEILKETFKLKDHGERDLGLRYDLTVPLARFVGMNPTIKMPFKRYQIGEVFRDGPVASARYRQFTQCDVDIVGQSSMAVDAEIIALACFAFGKLGLDVVLKFNSRKLLNDVLTYCGIPAQNQEAVILSIDKMEKFGADVVKKEIIGQNIDDSKTEKIISLISIKGSNEEKLKQLSKLIKDSKGIEELMELISHLKNLNVDAQFDPCLARGLAYYTGTVMEVITLNSGVKSSICGGGRYDKMIGSFLEKQGYPAVGISFGLDRIYDAMAEKEKGHEKTNTQIYVIPINALNDGMKIAMQLRNAGIKTDIDLAQRGPSKNLEYANSLGIPYALFAGKKELAEGKLKLRDMKSGREETMALSGVIEKIKYK